MFVTWWWISSISSFPGKKTNPSKLTFKNSSLKYLNSEDVKKEIQDLYPSFQIEFLINPHSKRDKFCFLLEEFYRLCDFATSDSLTPNENKALLSKIENLYSEIKKYDFNNFLINRSFTILKTIYLLFFIILVAAYLQKSSPIFHTY